MFVGRGPQSPVCQLCRLRGTWHERCPRSIFTHKVLGVQHCLNANPREDVSEAEAFPETEVELFYKLVSMNEGQDVP